MRFETITFQKQEDSLRVILLRLFMGSISYEDLASLGSFEVPEPSAIIFSKPKSGKRFLQMLANVEFTNKMTGNPVTYVHAASGIPLFGHVAFGIVYRGSSIIEIKPVTSCNLDCVYCSISEGLSSKKRDFVVEKNYLIAGLRTFLEWLNEDVEIHIGVQGEPFLYADMSGLIADLDAMPRVHTISIDTNGTLLNEQKIDALATSRKLQLNLSLDAIDNQIAKDVAGVQHYNVEHVKKVIAYATQKLSKVIVAPVLTQGWNEAELEKIILFIKSLPKQPLFGIQNFLRYKTGRSAGKEMSWPDFYALIEQLEKKHNIILRLHKEDFNIRKIKALPKPFTVGDIVMAEIVSPDRFPTSVIGAAADRCISIPGCSFVEGKKVRVKIIRDKHNIFTGQAVTKERRKIYK